MSLKTICWRISCLYDNLEQTGWRVFATHERANQLSGLGAVSLVNNNSHCKEEVVFHVQQKFS